MTYGKRNYRRKRNSRRKRRRTRRRRTTRMPKSMPFGYRKIVTHRYVEHLIDIDSGTGGTPASYVFSANGVYDPNITGTGHQPLGFDQMMLMYNHATVVSSKMTCKFINTDASYPTNVYIHLQDSSSISSDTQNIRENGRAIWGMCAAAGTTGFQKVLSMPFSTAKFFGRKGGDITNDDMFRSSSSSNPTEQAYYHLTVEPPFGIDLSATRIEVMITYKVIWTEPHPLTAS